MADCKWKKDNLTQSGRVDQKSVSLLLTEHDDKGVLFLEQKLNKSIIYNRRVPEKRTEDTCNQTKPKTNCLRKTKTDMCSVHWEGCCLLRRVIKFDLNPSKSQICLQPKGEYCFSVSDVYDWLVKRLSLSQKTLWRDQKEVKGADTSGMTAIFQQKDQINHGNCRKLIKIQRLEMVSSLVHKNRDCVCKSSTYILTWTCFIKLCHLNLN